MGFWSLGAIRQPKAQDIKWRKSPRGDYYRLFMLDDINDLGLNGTGGVYLLWHGGLKPSWLVAGATEDLGTASRNSHVTRISANMMVAAGCI